MSSSGHLPALPSSPVPTEKYKPGWLLHTSRGRLRLVCVNGKWSASRLRDSRSRDAAVVSCCVRPLLARSRVISAWLRMSCSVKVTALISSGSTRCCKSSRHNSGRS